MVTKLHRWRDKKKKNSSSSSSSIPSPRGTLGHHRWFCNQFSPFFPVLHCPLGLAELQACNYAMVYVCVWACLYLGKHKDLWVCSAIFLSGQSHWNHFRLSHQDSWEAGGLRCDVLLQEQTDPALRQAGLSDQGTSLCGVQGTCIVLQCKRLNSLMTLCTNIKLSLTASAVRRATLGI